MLLLLDAGMVLSGIIDMLVSISDRLQFAVGMFMSLRLGESPKEHLLVGKRCCLLLTIRLVCAFAQQNPASSLRNDAMDTSFK